MVESGKTNAYSFGHAFGMTAPSGRELGLWTKKLFSPPFSKNLGFLARFGAEPQGKVFL